MRSFSILIQFRFIYIYMLIYMIAGYFYESKLKILGYYSFIERYFGRFIFFILFIFVLDILSFFIKCPRKKMVYNIRVKFFILLGVSSILLWGMYKLNLPFEKIVLDEVGSKNLVDKFFYQYKFGLFLTFIFNSILGQIPFLYLYIGLYIMIFISFFFIAAKKIRVTITNIINERKRRKRLEIERKLIQEQIELMEALERKEKIQQNIEEEKEKIEDDISL